MARNTHRMHITRLEKRISKLLAALAPFAEEADAWSDGVSDGYHPGIAEPRRKEVHAKAAFSLRDLRRAKRLIEEFPNG